MLALGLIETKGLIGAIVAADTMLKAAQVCLLEKSLATGGLVTISVAGEVAAVQSAVDAAVVALSHVDGVQCVSNHVIPRPDAELAHVLRLIPPSGSPSGPPLGSGTVKEAATNFQDSGTAAVTKPPQPKHENAKKMRHRSARKEKE